MKTTITDYAREGELDGLTGRDGEVFRAALESARLRARRAGAEVRS